MGELKELSQFLMPFLQPNTYLILQGELGAGKTTLTQLIAKNLGIKEKVTSPTFTICQRYQIKNDYYLNHFDFFRLNINDNLDIFQELTFDNLNIIEWPEKNLQFWQSKKYIHLKLIKQSSEIRKVIIDFSFLTEQK
ncbi:MAG: tRNA (adenosine(37)-N6)-threonylcarbamoyltransferase complex ATPase subunit type 1 TsaE [Candidatus Moeniiplasma glomeromycotorum]|nr:tRNA (adenosine(37)-N6)-threonylcarbamoyltransferase complex ATPase subunit type 1 TsaE [Candidatus Moeniiplasma glomeromycotorum]